jgi:biopolymer transport protein ExbD
MISLIIIVLLLIFIVILTITSSKIIKDLETAIDKQFEENDNEDF